MIAVSVQPSSHPGRSDFPSPVGGDSLSRCPFLNPNRLKRSLACTHRRSRYNHRFVACLLIRDSPVLSPVASAHGNHCPPRAPLRDHGVTAFAPRSRRRSAGVTPPSSLLQAHASNHRPPVGFGFPYSFRSSQVVASPCCTAVFPDVISAILVKSPVSVPRHDATVLLSVSSRVTSASP